jgi:hypothetical protein
MTGRTFDRNSFRITHIARALTHSDGKFASLTGLSSAIYATGGLIASAPVCFERIPAEAAEEALKQVTVVDEALLPPSVTARVRDVELKHGLIRL